MIGGLSVVEGLVNHLWITVMGNSDLRKRLGLKYLSHMWDRNPYWYLWFQDIRGVFKLELRQVIGSEGYEWFAEFSVKYYPHPEDEYFKGLSLLEQICRRSEAFFSTPATIAGGCPCHACEHEGDSFSDLGETTGVPAFTAADRLPEDFFFAGKITLAKKEMGISIGLESQDHWRVVMSADYCLVDVDGREFKVLREGETDRDFSGFILTDVLYRKLILSLEALYGCRACSKEELITGGVAFYSDGSKLWDGPSGEIRRIVALSEINFREEGRPDGIALV